MDLLLCCVDAQSMSQISLISATDSLFALVLTLALPQHYPPHTYTPSTHFCALTSSVGSPEKASRLAFTSDALAGRL
jgi:hypothetical protein